MVPEGKGSRQVTPPKFITERNQGQSAGRYRLSDYYDGRETAMLGEQRRAIQSCHRHRRCEPMQETGMATIVRSPAA